MVSLIMHLCTYTFVSYCTHAISYWLTYYWQVRQEQLLYFEYWADQFYFPTVLEILYISLSRGPHLK